MFQAPLHLTLFVGTGLCKWMIDCIHNCLFSEMFFYAISKNIGQFNNSNVKLGLGRRLRISCLKLPPVEGSEHSNSLSNQSCQQQTFAVI